MSDLLGSRIVGGNTAYKRRESDFYPTPPDVTFALLDFLHLGGYPTHGVSTDPNFNHIKIWEPACGDGRMVDAIRSRGYECIGTDIQTGTDFLTAKMPEGVNFIITNPPFSLAEDFIRRCMYHEVGFALLLKSQFWHAKKRLPLFMESRPEYILPLTWRPDFMDKQRGGGSPLMDVMWCVWGACQFLEPRRPQHAVYIPLERPKEDSK